MQSICLLTRTQGSLRSLLMLYFLIFLATHIFSSILSVITFWDPWSTWLENEVANTNANLNDLQRDFDLPPGPGNEKFDFYHRPQRDSAWQLWLVSFVVQLRPRLYRQLNGSDPILLNAAPALRLKLCACRYACIRQCVRTFLVPSAQLLRLSASTA